MPATACDLQIRTRSLCERSVVPADHVVAGTAIDSDISSSGVDRIIACFAINRVGASTTADPVEAVSAADFIVAVATIDDVTGEVAGGEVGIGERDKHPVTVHVRSRNNWPTHFVVVLEWPNDAIDNFIDFGHSQFGTRSINRPGQWRVNRDIMQPPQCHSPQIRRHRPAGHDPRCRR